MDLKYCSFILSIQDKSLYLRHRCRGAANDSLTARYAKLANEVIRPG
jgi:hypothetical protein